MEVILKNDVENLGFADDIITVKNGYARNFLIPQGHAILATPSAKKMLVETLKQRAYKEQKLVDDAKKIASKLASLDVKLTAKAGEGDKLFGSISSADVATALENEGITIEKKYITIPGGLIKRIGQYEASVRFHRDVIATLPFTVVAEAK
jgi:large subunit ribosomal protein L9